MQNSLYSEQGAAPASLPNIPVKFNLCNRNEQSFLSILFKWKIPKADTTFPKITFRAWWVRANLPTHTNRFQLKMRKLKQKLINNFHLLIVRCPKQTHTE